MKFPHDDPDFGQVVSGLAERLDIQPGQIEKDHWITHVLWALHPAVTLLEKLDAISRRWPRADLAGRAFVRHYEDAASIIAALPALPPVPGGLAALITEMMEDRQLRAMPSAQDQAFALRPGERTDEVSAAWVEIAPLYWGERVTVSDAAANIREWVAANVPG